VKASSKPSNVSCSHRLQFLKGATNGKNHRCLEFCNRARIEFETERI